MNAASAIRRLAICLAVSIAALPEPADSNLREIVVVFKTHFDIGYTDLANKVIEDYQTVMMDKALAVCEAGRGLPPEQQFVWTIPGWPMTRILETDPARRGRILDAFREGRFVAHALPFTTHTESLELEELVRGFAFSSRLAEETGQPLPRDAKMTDVPSHSWVVPALLVRAGVDFLHLGCNPASASPDVPPLFWWEGPDGSRLLTCYSSAQYGSGLFPPDDWPHPVWLALIHTGDNQGPPPPEQVRELVEQAARERPEVKIRLGRLSDFADAVLAGNPDLPVIRGDMPDTWIHGILSMPQATAAARRYRPKVYALEALDAMSRLWGLEPEDCADIVNAAYERGLLFGEHTWGHNFGYHRKRVYGDDWRRNRMEGAYEKDEISWREKAAHIEILQQLVRPRLDERMKSLAYAANVDGPRVTVFNPLPWPRDGMASVPYYGEARRFVDAETGEPVPADVSRNRLRFIAKNVPPLGYKTYKPAEGEAEMMEPPADGAVLENEWFRIRLDPATGRIVSVHDKHLNREWAAQDRPFDMGGYLRERFNAADVGAFLRAYDKINVDWSRSDLGKIDLPEGTPSAADTIRPVTFAAVRDAVESRAEIELEGGGARLVVTAPRGLPYIDFAWAVENKPADPWPEAGWLCFPLNVSGPSFRLDRLGGVADPSRNFVRSTNHEVFCLNGGLAVTGPDGAGIGLCPLDSPLASLGRTGLWRYTREWTPRGANVFFNLYNNQWSTNFAQWVEGTWSSTVRMWSFGEYGNENSLTAPSLEARYPLEAAFADGGAGGLPASQAGVALTGRGIQITSIQINEAADRLSIRLWERAGKGGVHNFTLPAGTPAESVRRLDLRGTPLGGALPADGGTIEAETGAYEPVTLDISLNPER